MKSITTKSDSSQPVADTASCMLLACLKSIVLVTLALFLINPLTSAIAFSAP